MSVCIGIIPLYISDLILLLDCLDPFLFEFAVSERYSNIFEILFQYLNIFNLNIFKDRNFHFDVASDEEMQHEIEFCTNRISWRSSIMRAIAV